DRRGRLQENRQGIGHPLRGQPVRKVLTQVPKRLLKLVLRSRHRKPFLANCPTPSAFREAIGEPPKPALRRPARHLRPSFTKNVTDPSRLAVWRRAAYPRLLDCGTSSPSVRDGGKELLNAEERAVDEASHGCDGSHRRSLQLSDQVLSRLASSV